MKAKELSSNSKDHLGLNLNLALAYKKLNNYEKCFLFSQLVIDEDDQNPKAW